jgi:hypothetical protein
MQLVKGPRAAPLANRNLIIAKRTSSRIFPHADLDQ